MTEEQEREWESAVRLAGVCDPCDGGYVVLYDHTILAADADLRALREENARLSDLLWGARCVYCGEVVGAEKQNQHLSDADLRAHVLVCPKHPATALRARVAELEGAIVAHRAAPRGGTSGMVIGVSEEANAALYRVLEGGTG